jgi:lipoprotein-anchoring transpeptidase ErfK/SrfK
MQSSGRKIRISVSAQRLDLIEGGDILRSFPVSTSAFGLGTEQGSFKTPTGNFTIAEKVGDGAELGAVFKSRAPTGEIGREENPGDLIQTRILWLHGTQAHNANTRDRYIYIHGTNHESDIGRPASHGCIRMRNTDVAELYGMVDNGTEVIIET